MKQIGIVCFGILSLCLFYGFGMGRPPAIFNNKDIHASAVEDSPFFLVISDIHLNTCRKVTDVDGDTDPSSWNITKTELAKLLDKKPRFVLFTGDMPAHHADVKAECNCDKHPVDHFRRRDYDTVLQNFYALLKGRDIPFFFVPGNNDVATGDYGKFTENNKNVFSDVKNMYPTPTLNTGVSKTHYPYIDSLNSEDCYYSVCIASNLRLIVLNSIILCKSEANTYSQDDGFKELDWMKTELQKARNKKQSVYIAMHIPPGEGGNNSKKNPGKALWKKSLVNGFLSSTDTYNDLIKGIFYGHIHTDECRFLYNKGGDSIKSVAFSCPAITSYKHGNNPGFKMMDYDKATNSITDVITYYRDIDIPTGGWQQYSYSQIFGCQNGVGFINALMTKANKDLTKISGPEHAIFFLKRNAGKNPEDYPEPEEMKVIWR